ncbi:MAG: hypothetical protein LUF85_05445 [Bacteroides sp.]|nr:hypothetical protein [Bacteroides sp.]
MKKKRIHSEQTEKFREQLGQLSLKRINNLVDFVAGHPESLADLFALIDDPDPRVNWRAAWACKYLGLRNPELLLPYREELIGKACRYTQPGIRREVLSLLYNLPVSEPFPVMLFDLCLERMLAPDETVAIQALCIKMAYRLSLVQPELLPELALYLENADPTLYQKGTMATLHKTRLLVQKKLKPNR